MLSNCRIDLNFKTVSKQHLEKERDFRGIKKPANEPELTKVPDDVLYLFSIRYQIETELKRIMKETPYQWNLQRIVSQETSNERKPRRMVPAEIVRILISNGLIDCELADIIMHTYSIQYFTKNLHSSFSHHSFTLDQYFTNWIRKSSSFIPISKYFSVKCLKS